MAELQSISNLLALSQQAWRVGRAFTEGKSSGPDQFAEIEKEAIKLSDLLKTVAETLQANDCILPSTELRARTAVDAIVERAARILRELEGLMERYQVIRNRESTGGFGLSRLWGLANYQTIKLTTDGGDLTDLRNRLRMHNDTIGLTVQALQWPSVAEVQREILIIADNTSSDVTLQKAPPSESSDVTRDPEVEARQSPRALEVQPDLENLEALLDPESYFSSLDNLERSMIDQCQIREMFVQDKYESSTMACQSYTPGSIEQLSKAIDMLQENGYCREHAIILIEDETREGVVKAVELKISDIIDITGSRLLTNYTRYQRATKARKSLLTSLGLHATQYTLYQFLYLLLLVGLISYAGSHCSSLESSIWDDDIDSITIPGIRMDSPHSSRDKPPWIFHRRRLNCLDAFIGSPVWVFGTSRSSKPASLSITVKQFADLWGPTFAIPRHGDFSSLVALKVDGGVIHRVDAAQSEHGEIPMHFVPTKSMRKEILGDGNCSDHLLYSPTNDETLPEHLESFPAAAQLIIGHPAPSTTVTAGTRVRQPPSCQILVAEPEPLLLNINGDCTLDVQRFRRDNAHRLQPLGTKADQYVPDEFQAGFSAGQHVNVGYQKVWRRRQGITYKNMLLEYCSKPQAKIAPMLSLQVGLQFSMCTGNAKRISLWDALILSYPEQVDELETMRQRGDSMSIAAYIHQLAQTGINEQGHLQLFWPYKPGIPDIFELDVSAPSWTRVLKETRTSTCFALMSSHCLSYHGWDKLAGEQDSRIVRACHGSPLQYPTGLLQTVISLNPASQAAVPGLPLKPKTRLKLSEGSLQMRNTALAAYHEPSPFHRFNERYTSVFNIHPGCFHSELLDPGRASNCALSLCIMNQP